MTLQRLTVAVPDNSQLVKGANHVHVLLSHSEDFNTYEIPRWKDSSGNEYHVSSGMWTDTQIDGLVNPKDYKDVVIEFMELYPEIDLEAVTAANTAFRLYNPEEDGTPFASPNNISAVIHDEAFEALRILGLTPIEEETEA